MNGKPHLVGIVGGSGSGKSWLADQLRERLGKEAGRISLDNFYRDRSHLPVDRRASINFDHPRAVDWPLVRHVLEDCLAGRTTYLPQYDFTAHARSEQWESFSPKSIVLMDGLWLLRRAAVRRLLALRIFLDCSEPARLERRVQRDVRERGRTETSVKEQFIKMVAPMHARFVEGQKMWANVVLTGPPTTEDADRLADRLKQIVEG